MSYLQTVESTIYFRSLGKRSNLNYFKRKSESVANLELRRATSPSRVVYSVTCGKTFNGLQKK